MNGRLQQCLHTPLNNSPSETAPLLDPLDHSKEGGSGRKEGERPNLSFSWTKAQLRTQGSWVSEAMRCRLLLQHGVCGGTQQNRARKVWGGQFQGFLNSLWRNGTLCGISILLLPQQIVTNLPAQDTKCIISLLYIHQKVHVSSADFCSKVSIKIKVSAIWTLSGRFWEESASKFAELSSLQL